jgi:hypothetical protein
MRTYDSFEDENRTSLRHTPSDPGVRARLTLCARRSAQARLRAEVGAAADAEARLAAVVAAMERCQASASDMDALADAYSQLQVSRPASDSGVSLRPQGTWPEP